MVSCPPCRRSGRRGSRGWGLRATRRLRTGAATRAHPSTSSFPLLENADVSGDPFDPFEIVGGEEDRRAAVGELADELVEDEAAGDRVEAEGRVVEEEELRALGQGEREHDESLLAAGEITEALARSECRSGRAGYAKPAASQPRWNEPTNSARASTFIAGGASGVSGVAAIRLHEPVPGLPGVEAVDLQHAAVGLAGARAVPSPASSCPSRSCPAGRRPSPPGHAGRAGRGRSSGRSAA